MNWWENEGFDHDDNVQQALALIVLAVDLLLFLFVPTTRLGNILFTSFGVLSASWYLLIAKGIWRPFLFLAGFRDLGVWLKHHLR